MTKSGFILSIIGVLLLLIALGWGVQHYNTSKQQTEQQAAASLNRGIALFHEKKYADSLEVLKAIPDGVLKDWHLPYYVATAHVMLKDYEAAAPILEKALVLNPQEAQIMFELGVVYYKLGNLGLSKGYFASVLEIDPSNEEAKGLMDIMANLERQQPGYSETGSEEKTGN
ncbi:tetratricopeptide repeat protein [Pseudomonadota bacterium]